MDGWTISLLISLIVLAMIVAENERKIGELEVVVERLRKEVDDNE